MNMDNRTFKYAGSSCDTYGNYKARFANDPEARPKVLTKAGHTNFVLVELPNPMTKLEAIAWLKANKPEGVNLESLDSKENYLTTLQSKINGTAVPKKRGRPRKNPLPETTNSTVTTPTTNSIANTIVTAARGGSLRAKATNQASKIAAAKK